VAGCDVRSVTVRPILAYEVGRFNALAGAHHRSANTVMVAVCTRLDQVRDRPASGDCRGSSKWAIHFIATPAHGWTTPERWCSTGPPTAGCSSTRWSPTTSTHPRKPTALVRDLSTREVAVKWIAHSSNSLGRSSLARASADRAGAARRCGPGCGSAGPDRTDLRQAVPAVDDRRLRYPGRHPRC
jgi:hypothetical protein